MDEVWLIPRFAIGRSFNDQKVMIEKFLRATVSRFPNIGIWTLNEPIAQNGLGWSRDQIYDVFVSASKWIHETNPKAKVMINMIPIPANWSGLEYEPNHVLDDLLERGLEPDIIGIELYYWWAPTEKRDENGYPMLDWVKSKVDIFRKYNLPIIFSEVGIPGIIDGKNQFDKQADWMEAFFSFCHDDEDIIGATWYCVRDEPGFMPYAGLMDDDFTYRPVANRLIKIANELNSSTTHILNGRKYLDLAPGRYDVIVNQEVIRVNVIKGQTVTIGE
jgi:GH35 family endo-1,4-beta-xylanase